MSRNLRLSNPQLTFGGREDGACWALIIGINQYQDPAIDDLSFAAQDAQAIYDLLIDPQRGGFDPQRVALMTDQAESDDLRPERSRILQRLRLMVQQVEAQDTMLVFFAGHGQEEEGV